VVPEQPSPAPAPQTTTPPPLTADDRKAEVPKPEPGKECGVRREVERPNGPDGIETGFGEFPWHAQVLKSSDQSPACSAAILAENIVVTSAFCVEK